jgi:hypothetical protein
MAGDFYTNLKSYSYPGPEAGSPDHFAAVQSELLTEFPSVTRVHSLEFRPVPKRQLASPEIAGTAQPCRGSIRGSIRGSMLRGSGPI